MAFHAEVFPSKFFGFRSTFGILHRNAIFTQPNGQELRSGKWSQPRRTWEAVQDIRTIADLRELQEFVVAREGSAHSFLVLDPFEHTTATNRRDAPAFDDVRIGTGDGVRTKFFLSTRYESGTVVSTCADCEITRPLRYTKTIVAGIDGVAKDGGGIDFTENHAEGSITWVVPPPRGAGVFAGADFYTKARFDLDLDAFMQASHDGFEAGSVSVSMIEEKLPTITEDRDLSGTATSADAGTTLTDTAATFRADGVREGDTIVNVTDGSSATVTHIASETVLEHTALSGGTQNDWDIGESYLVSVRGIVNLDRPVFGGGKLHSATTGTRYLSFQDGLFNLFTPTEHMTIRLPDIHGAGGVPGYEEAIEAGGLIFVVFNVGLAEWWDTNYTLTFEQLNSAGNWTTHRLGTIRPNRTARFALGRRLLVGDPEWRMW